MRTLLPLRTWALLCLVTWLAGCGPHVPQLPRLAEADVVLAFGDSLTHGTGAGAGEDYPSQLQALIGRPVVNAGVPGDTTAEGVQRLPELLATHRPRLLLLCLGGNDMLRRLEVAEIAGNLITMVRLARDQGVAVMLIGVPQPNLLAGPPGFYDEIAREYRLPYEDRAFDKVLKTGSLKSDPVHPNAAGYRQVAERVAELLREAGAI